MNKGNILLPLFSLLALHGITYTTDQHNRELYAEHAELTLLNFDSSEHSDWLAFYASIMRSDIELSAGGLIGIGQSPGTSKLSIAPGTNVTAITLATSGTVPNLVLSGGTPALSITAGGETITAGDLTLSSGNIILTDSTSASTGNIFKGSNRFMNNFGTVSTCLGELAGNFTHSGTHCTAIGASALTALTSGNFNTGIGAGALALTTSGEANTAVGTSALANNTNSYNTAVGYLALGSITSGSLNVGIGPNSLLNCTTNSDNIAIGVSALHDNAADKNIAIGTNTLKAGLGGVTGSNNIAIGYRAMEGNTSGANNVAIGYQAMRLNATGSNNISIGYSSTNLSNSNSILLSVGGSTSANDQIKIGFGTSANTSALIDGIVSTSIGTSANLVAINSSGQLGTTATQSYSLSGSRFITTVGTDNTAVGVNASNTSVTGTENTCLGVNAGPSLSSGGSNTVIGKDAANSLSTGQRSIFVGRGASFSSNNSNCINIQTNNGGGTQLSGNNQIRIGFNDTAMDTCFIDGIYAKTVGGSGATVFVDSSGQLGTNISSRRYKENIESLSDISTNFMQLNPVSFSYKSDETHTPVYGLIAEEVEALFPELVSYNKDGQIETVKYHLLDAFFIKMIQENRRLALENRKLIEQLQQAFALLQARCSV